MVRSLLKEFANPGLQAITDKCLEQPMRIANVEGARLGYGILLPRPVWRPQGQFDSFRHYGRREKLDAQSLSDLTQCAVAGTVRTTALLDITERRLRNARHLSQLRLGEAAFEAGKTNLQAGFERGRYDSDFL
jgi:hypothetical protein